MTSPHDRARAYLEEARAQRPKLDPRRREHLKQAVLAGVAGTAVAASSASAAGSWFTSLGAKVVMGLTAAAVGSGLTYGVMKTVVPHPAPVAAASKPIAPAVAIARPTPAVEVASASEPVVVVEPVVEQPPRAAPRLPRTSEAAPPPAPVAEETPPIVPAPEAPKRPQNEAERPPEVVAAPTARRPTQPAPSPALDEELGHLRKAMSLHEAQDEAGAATVLATYEAQFPHGVLRVEALTLRVLVACARGRTDDADVVWRVLEREAPHVLSTPRLQQSCARH